MRCWRPGKHIYLDQYRIQETLASHFVELLRSQKLPASQTGRNTDTS